MSWCDRHSILQPEQSAFRPGRDAQEQVALLTQRAVQAMNGGLVTAVAALDVAKAFDSVWHAGLVRQCIVDLPTGVARWVAAFLRDRTAAVLEDGSVSRRFPTLAGVPQGSPISPLLYAFYTRSMPLPRTPMTGATVYADDVAVWASAQTPAAAWSLLEPRLQEMVEWGRCWRLRFSPEKTQLICLSRRTGWTLPSVSFDGAQLEWAAHLDLLGVRLDRMLRFRQHAVNVCQRLRPTVLELRRLTAASRAVPVWVGALLYKSLVRSSLLFAVPTLTMACETTWLTLETLERHALRAALRLSQFWRTPNAEVYRRTRIDPLRRVASERAASFLQRHVRSRNRRLLAGFASCSSGLTLMTCCDCLWFPLITWALSSWLLCVGVLSGNWESDVRCCFDKA